MSELGTIFSFTSINDCRLLPLLYYHLYHQGTMDNGQLPEALAAL
jgi:hypothetical protein